MARYRYQKTPMGNGQQDIPRTWGEETGDHGHDSWHRRQGELRREPPKSDGYVTRKLKGRRLI